MTQSERVLGYMKQFGSISPIDAMQDLGCFRLASRVNDLRRAGHRIVSGMDTAKNRYGNVVHFARYSLEQQ